jgi:asparagine synthase (glutamine-hydrolysing)
MCGFAGRFHPVALAPAEAWCRQADRLLWHRGPDSAGAFRDGRCELVHRRLALIDLSPTGHQPLANEDGTVLIAYNGEVYNHRELRRDLLARGHVFRGTSDTEALVHLYEDAGPGLVDQLRGIFAFAIYDARRGRLVLARDRFGVKPLFWARHGEEWVFASEMKAILALPGFRPELDRQACYDYLSLAYVPEPATGFANIHALPPGTTLTVDADGQRFQEYYQARAHPGAPERVPDMADRVGAALLDATARQSVADVPVAALLSGGIDSSLVVAAHARATGTTTTTFNVRFPEKGFDETARAVAVAQRYQTQHHTIDVGDHAMSPDAIVDLMRHFDQPFADTSFVPMYWVSQAVRDRGIVCTLSGDGGDEVFGGYPSFWRLNRIRSLMRLPGWSRGLARTAARRATGVAPDFGRQLLKAVQLADAAHARPASLLAGLATYLGEAEKQALVEPEARVGLAPAWRLFDGMPNHGVPGLEAFSQRLTDGQFAVSLPSEMLRKVDMMSMRASIEVRVPMLDDQVVAQGLALAHRHKTDGRRGKLVLRALADRWLPPSVAGGPKQGFNIPIDVMVPPGFHDLLADLLLSDSARTRGLLNPPLIRQWLGAFRHPGRGDFLSTISRWGLYQRVFAALALEHWLRDYSLTW